MSAATAYLERVGFTVEEIVGAIHIPGLHIVAEDNGFIVGVMVRVIDQAEGYCVEAEEDDREALMMDCDGRSIDRLDIIDLQVLSPERALLRHHRGIWTDAGDVECDDGRDS